jgi:uncharacterized membrane protein
MTQVVRILTVFSLGLFCLTTPILGQDGSSQGSCTFQRPQFPNSTFHHLNNINDIGAIVGFDGNLKGFLLFNGKLTTFEFPGAIFTQARDINNHAQIVGSYDSTNISLSTSKGFFVHAGGFKTINVPNSIRTDANGINDKGDIVGDFVGQDNVQRAFLLHDGHFSAFTFPNSFGFTVANSINVHATIVGFFVPGIGGRAQGFMVRNGVFTAINFPGAEATEITKINNEGEMVGLYAINGIVHGFSLDKGRFTTIDVPNTTDTMILGLNNRDQIIATAIEQNHFDQGFEGNCQKVF